MKRFVTVMSKVLEVLFLLLSVTMVVAMIYSIVSPQKFYDFIKDGLDSNQMNVLGLSVQIVDDAGSPMKVSMALLFGFSIFVSLNMVMIFRNIFLIYRTASGKTWFSKGNTPFQKDIVRMVREIGIFNILVFVIQFIACLVIKLVYKGDIETSVIITGLIFGFVVLSLSQIFEYGEKLEKDVEGLI